MSRRGGPRVPGEGKRLGRPRKSGAERVKRRQIYLSDADWARVVEFCEQGVGASGSTPGQVVAEALRRLSQKGRDS